MLTADELTERIEDGAMHPIFRTLEEASDRDDAFAQAFFEGYLSYYNRCTEHPVPFSDTSFYRFLAKIIDVEPADLFNENYLKRWKMGYIAGWCVALGENDQTLFHEDSETISIVPTISPWVIQAETKMVEMVHRVIVDGTTQFAISDDCGMYVATITPDGSVSCTCGEPGCEHGHVAVRVNKQLN